MPGTNAGHAREEDTAMAVTSPGLDELHTILAKRQAEEDAITLELERRRAGVVSEIATLQEAIRILEAEHSASPSPPDAPEAHQEATADEQTPVVLPVVLDAPEDPHEAVAVTETPPALAAPLATPASVSAPPARSRRASGPNWQRELAGLQQGDAAVRVAERSGGTVTVAQVAEIFVEAGLTRAAGRRARDHAAHVLGESQRLERVRRGTYRLRSASPCGATVENPAAD
jgi:hypothetical protein